jgi:hypothetical protein
MSEILLDRNQAYHSLYGFLEVLWSRNQDLYQNGLPILLGDLNPFLWTEGGSADPAMDYDWANVWGEHHLNSPEEAYEIARRFVIFYNSLYSVPDSELLDILNHWEIAEYKALWLRICRSTLSKNLLLSSQQAAIHTIKLSNDLLPCETLTNELSGVLSHFG